MEDTDLFKIFAVVTAGVFAGLLLFASAFWGFRNLNDTDKPGVPKFWPSLAMFLPLVYVAGCLAVISPN